MNLAALRHAFDDFEFTPRIPRQGLLKRDRAPRAVPQTRVKHEPLRFLFF
jgi:hypothetical protein